MTKVQQINVVQESAANTLQTVTQAALADHTHWIDGWDIFVKTAAVGAAAVLVELKSGTTIKWRGYLPAAAAIGSRHSVDFMRPIQLVKGEAANLDIGALGTSSISVATLRGATRRG